MKTQWLLLSLIIITISCTKSEHDPVVQVRNQHFVGQIIDFSTNNPIEGSDVYLSRVTGYRTNPSSFSYSNLIKDTTNSNTFGTYSFSLLNNYEQNFYSFYVQKPGYVFIKFPIKYDTIYKNRDTIITDHYLDKASHMRIHIKDVAPLLLPTNFIDVYREYRDPVTGSIHYAYLKTFEGSIDAILTDTFSYKLAPNVKISWQVRTSTGIPANALIVPSSINEFGTTDININY